MVRHKTLWLLGTFIYPSWWVLFHFTSGGFSGSLTQYLCVAGMFLLATLSTWWSPVIAKQTQRIHIALTWVLTAHYFYVLGLNHLAADQVIGAFVAVSVVSATYVTKRETFCYAVFVMVLALALPDPEGDVGRWTLVYGLFTVLVISFVANHDRLRMIGSLRESKESLREADAKKRDILNSIFDGFAILDSEYRIVYVNPVGENLVSLSGLDYHGKVLWDFFPDAVSLRFSTAFAHAMQGQTVEFEEYLPSQECWFEVRATPIRDGISIFFRDVSARKMMEKEVEEQKMKVIVSSKLSTLGEMAGGIAHEINNPLAIISARAQVLKHRAENGSYSREDVLKIADSIEQTASRIERIIKALRNVARDGESDPVEQVSIDEVVSHALEVCRERFRHHGVRLFTPNIPADMYLDCRPVQISQVLLNLLANAFDAVSAFKDGWVSLEIIDLGSKVQLCVTDSGAGISLEAQIKMFEPFFTTKEVGKGTGLGLSISRSIVESHGGHLFYQLHEGHTRFVVEMPKFSCMSVQIAV